MKKITLTALVLLSLTACSSDDLFLEDLNDDLRNESVWEEADRTELERLGCSIEPNYSNSNLTPEMDCPLIGEEFTETSPFNQHAYDMFIALFEYEQELVELESDYVSAVDSTNLLLLKVEARMLKFDYLPLLPLEVRSELLELVNQ